MSQISNGHKTEHSSMFNRVKLSLGGDPALNEIPTDERLRGFRPVKMIRD
jgi:hypothetical protein